VRSGETAVRAFSPQSETIAVDAFTTACEPPFLSSHRGMTTNDERPPARRMENGRLAYYKHAATSIFWDGIWDAVLKPDFFAPYLRGYLHFFHEPFEKHLPKQGRILEAGCGTGQYVAALRARGYDCLGADYAADTIRRVRATLPDLPLVVGDVTTMSFPSRSFAAVISLGVVEHRREGPEPFLREMHRVLDDDGVLLVSVPHFNLLRRLRARLAGYRQDVADLSFYQWAFTPEEFRRLLSAEGFIVADEFDYNYSKCLLDDIGWLNRLPEVAYKSIIKLAGLVPAVRAHLGHMRLFIATKSDRAPERVVAAARQARA
jgi:SAM-dependent methyltransferase